MRINIFRFITIALLSSGPSELFAMENWWSENLYASWPAETTLFTNEFDDPIAYLESDAFRDYAPTTQHPCPLNLDFNITHADENVPLGQIDEAIPSLSPYVESTAENHQQAKVSHKRKPLYKEDYLSPSSSSQDDANDEDFNIADVDGGSGSESEASPMAHLEDGSDQLPDDIFECSTLSFESGDDEDICHAASSKSSVSATTQVRMGTKPISYRESSLSGNQSDEDFQSDAKAAVGTKRKRQVRPCEERKKRKTHVSKSSPYTCSTCKKSFPDNSKLERHEAIHRNERPHTCSQCPSDFKTKDNLVRHIREQHAAVKKEFICECGATLSSRDNLQAHKRNVHGPKKKLRCPYQGCPSRFTQNCKLTRHINEIHGDDAYECEGCGKQFSNKSNCSRHEKTCLFRR